MEKMPARGAFNLVGATKDSDVAEIAGTDDPGWKLLPLDAPEKPLGGSDIILRTRTTPDLVVAIEVAKKQMAVGGASGGQPEMTLMSVLP